jgi:hypothetical protein
MPATAALFNCHSMQHTASNHVPFSAGLTRLLPGSSFLPQPAPQQQGLAMHRHHQDQLHEQQAMQLQEPQHCQLPSDSHQQQQHQQREDEQQLLQVSVSRAEDPPGFQLLVTLPGCCLEDVRIKAWDDGRLLIRAALQPAATGSAGSTHAFGANPAAATANAAGLQLGDTCLNRQGASAEDAAQAAGVGVQTVERIVQLPGRIAASTAGALMTHHGQLYVRVNDAQ